MVCLNTISQSKGGQTQLSQITRMEDNLDSQDKQPLADKTELSSLDHTAKKPKENTLMSEMKESRELIQPKHPGQTLNLLVISWNLMGTLPNSRTVKQLLSPERMQNDLIIIGTQECQRSLFASFFCESKESWETLLNQHMEREFRAIGSQVLQGIHSIAYIKKEYYSYVSEFKTNKIKTGFMGIVGNKGATELEFHLGDRHLLFINTHLQAFQQQSQRRNHDLLTIVSRLVEGQPADYIFFFGDLNYRLMIPFSQASKLNKKPEEYLKLRGKDQLLQQEVLKGFLQKYKQAQISFPPSYKMSTVANTYAQTRIPGWTDRIFFNSSIEDIQQTSYTCDFNILGSDHRPVFATFKSKLRKKEPSKEVQVRPSASRCTLM